MNYRDIIVFDFETGSRNPYKTQPTQIAAVAIHGRKLTVQPGGYFNSEMRPILDDDKAIDVAHISLSGKSSIADHMVIASGTSQRHISAMADNLRKKTRSSGFHRPAIEGRPQCDWVLIDTGDVIVHLFRPEVRNFYALEKMWTATLTEENSDNVETVAG